MTLRVPRKVIWSIDAFDTPSSPLLRSTAETAKRLIESFKARVEPVYVLSPGELNLSSEFSVPWVSRYRPYAEQALADLFKRLDISGLEPPRVIVQESASTSRAIEALSDYAIASEVDTILTSTHGRAGMKRLLMGSFTEALMLKSHVPVIVVGPESPTFEGGSPLDPILFATDLGEHAKPLFHEAVELARESGARLTLFHVIPHPIEPIVSSGVYLLGGGWVPMESYFAEETRLRERRAQAWVKWANMQGVNAEAAIEYRGVSISQRIVQVAQEHQARMIIMEAQTGPVASALIGSVTREVVRGAHCPVWVIGPKAKAEAVAMAA